MSADFNVGATAPEQVTPGSDNAGCGAGVIEGKGNRDGAVCRAAGLSDQAAGKAKSTLIAQLALHGGHVVHELADGTYLVTWRAFSRECRGLAELEAHARRVGAMP